jgi:nitric oxide reductase subunit C
MPFTWRTCWRWRRRGSTIAGLVVVVAVALVARFITAAQGDAARGAKLFASQPCASCHDTTHPWPGGDVCPNLGNIATEAARIVRRPDYHGRARDAAGYIRESILAPDAYVVPGAAYRQADGQSVMPKTFAQTLKPAELDDLVAYLMTLR